MQAPPVPKLRPRQNYAHRTWKTEYMMEVLSVYYRSKPQEYPKTWRYRVLIMCHREQHSSSVYRKGYGADWKNLKQETVGGVKRWVVDAKAGGISIKDEVLEYARFGRLPLDSLKLAAGEIRKLELAIWRDEKLAQRLKSKPRLLEAAE